MMKTYQLNGRTYTEDEVIAVHDMWHDIQAREDISECLECALPEWGVWQCLSQNCLLRHYLVADKVKELHEEHQKKILP